LRAAALRSAACSSNWFIRRDLDRPDAR